jgi:hypothetical protein
MKKIIINKMNFTIKIEEIDEKTSHPFYNGNDEVIYKQSKDILIVINPKKEISSYI